MQNSLPKRCPQIPQVFPLLSRLSTCKTTIVCCFTHESFRNPLPKVHELYKPSLNLKILPTQFAIINILCTVRFFRHCCWPAFAYILSIFVERGQCFCFFFFFVKRHTGGPQIECLLGCILNNICRHEAK